jgi:diguanylate cyclase (GGDEF)-like protein/PAS domain S-box-containing protein
MVTPCPGPAGVEWSGSPPRVRTTGTRLAQEPASMLKAPGNEVDEVFERITDAYIALDRDWTYTYVNAHAGELLGRQPEDLVGHRLWDDLPEGAGGRFDRACREAMASGQAVTMEAFYPPTARWLENRIFPGPDGLTVYFRDITRRKRQEETIHHQQRMLDEAQRVAHLGSWEWRIGAERVNWTAELFRIYGLPQSAEGPTFAQFMAHVHPDDRPRVQAAIERALAERRPVEFEERIRHADGRERLLASRGEVQLDAQGQPERLVGVCRDVTEERRNARLDAGQRAILEGIAAQRPLAASLARICLLHEQLNPGALCSILLMDAERLRVRHGAAPSLPDAFNAAIDGQAIGPDRGSCGTAAFRAERVVAHDIATDPRWAEFRTTAQAHGLRACWSTPILGSSGQVLGTFAIYYREPRAPSPEELEYIDRMLPIAAIAIESEERVERLRERDRFFDMALEIFCIFDPATEHIVQVNAAFERVTGHSAHTLTSRHYLDFVHPDDRAAATSAVSVVGVSGGRVSQFAYRFLCADGSYRWLEWDSIGGEDGLAFAVAHDITERRRIEAELDYAATHDPVTGLEHHLVLERNLATLLDEAVLPVWIVFVGLDRFQVVNESMGHAIGDDVLQRVAARLLATVGDAGHVARFAGDEFVVAAPALDRHAALALAERLRTTVAEPIEGADYRLLLTASIGLSQSPAHGRSLQELLRRAEAAMVRAKRQGRDQVCEFSVEQMQDIEDRIVCGRALRGAVHRGEMALHYQPQHRADDHQLTGFEALLRWDSRELGRVSPARFIPIAEALGLMPEIGAWVIDEACRQARAWLDIGHADFCIAVNVSAQQMQRPGLVEHVRAALARHALPADVLGIELTESSLMENVGRVRGTLEELKALGVRLSLDDFGTGYSSLAYLKQFPLDTLKIDQSFVRGLPDDAHDAAIARTIVAIAHQLRMVVAAEGVETQAQAVFLHAIGCDELQGYHLGRPAGPEDAALFFPTSGAQQPSLQ